MLSDITGSFVAVPKQPTRLQSVSSVGHVFPYDGSKILCSGRSALVCPGDESCIQAEEVRLSGGEQSRERRNDHG